VSGTLGIPIRIHPADAVPAGLAEFAPIAPEEIIEVGDLRLRAIHTPGHTPGSTCFLLDDLLFSGDTLFPGGPGATHSPDQFAEIMGSLERHLFALPDETRVLPGHGLDTTIGAERPSLPEWRRRGY
jgi:glyoxylase-like metal-dependent hydrolase (beta-lactamase superfamily II)